MFCHNCGAKCEPEMKFCKECGAQLIASTTPPSLPSEPAEAASRAQRFLHLIVDTFGMYLFAIFVGGLVVVIFRNETVGIAVGWLAFFLYYFLFESLFQTSLAKKLTSTVVVSVDGSKPSVGQIFIRSIARYIPFEPLSFLFYGVHPTKGWHDRLSGTLVVSNKLTAEQIKTIAPNQRSNNLLVIIFAVVICMIIMFGLASSVILSSLADSRDKGLDAAMKSSVNNLRAQAELYYYDAEKNSYAGFCESETFYNFTGKFDSSIDCNDSANTYVFNAELSNGSYYCADNTGYAGPVVQYIDVTKESCTGAKTESLPIAIELENRKNAGTDAMRKSSTNFLRVDAELYYESNSSSYDGFCESTAVYQTINDDNIAIDCNDTTQEYALSTRLTDGTYYCIDSDGNTGTYKESLKGTTLCLNNRSANETKVERTLKYVAPTEEEVDRGIVDGVQAVVLLGDNYYAMTKDGYGGFCATKSYLDYQERFLPNQLRCIANDFSFAITAFLYNGNHYCLDSNGYARISRDYIDISSGSCANTPPASTQ